jgi:hypothetical protein
MGNSARWDEDVTVREVPVTRLLAIGWLVFLLVVSGMAAWELQMRSLGLVAGDLDDSKAHWAVERRKVAAGNYDGVVIIGSSRILFDTDLDIWKEMTGRRPIQLAMPGSNPRPFLKEFAEDPDFHGLLVVGVTPDLFFADRISGPEFAGVSEYWKQQTPSERFGHQVDLFLSRYLGFLEDQYTLTALIDHLDLPNRGKITRPYLGVWKLSESHDDRQTFMWPRLVHDQQLIEHAKRVWMNLDRRVPNADVIARACSEAKRDVGMIRSRGGEVVFVRAPSAGAYYAREAKSTPRARTWDRLLAETGAFGIHFEDYPQMRGLEIPEMSHLSRDSATRFTRAYVDVMMKNSPWLSAHARASSAAGAVHG